MKKFLLIGLIVSLALILVGGAGVVFARAGTVNQTSSVRIRTNGNGDKIVEQFNGSPEGKNLPYCFGPGGMMRGYGPGRMMGGPGTTIERGYGFMHDDMISAFASAVGLTVDEVNTRLTNGETLTQIANAQGFTGDKLTQLVAQVHKSTLDKAVADGIITQAQADRMLQMMNNYSGPGFSPGFGFENCPMWDNNESQP
jgi:hypothetical protein